MPPFAERNRSADAAAVLDERRRIEHWDSVAAWQPRFWKSFNACYHRRLAEIYRFLIPPGRKVLELGCGRGDLLAAVEPCTGVGLDFSPEMIAIAKQRHPGLRFVVGNAQDFEPGETFDFVILSDLVNDLWDVQAVLEQIHAATGPASRIIINTYSNLWEVPRKTGEKLGLVSPLCPQNWLTVEDLENLLALAGFEVIRHWPEVLWPIRTPLIDGISNRYLVKLWPFRIFALTNFLVARPNMRGDRRRPTVSVVIPARNEEGNIDAIFRRVPEMGAGTELVFVEGHSSDGTYAEMERAMARYPERRCKLLKQTGRGKGDAVRLGFAYSEGDVLMILDADLTAPPEDLPRFVQALSSGAAEFVNGVRLVYPMEKQAMRFFNLLGNKFFSLAFSWLLGQDIKDTLCGTKALSREHYEQIAAGRSYFGDFDPFGDFDLIFGAAKCNLKIVDLPVRYRERVYGQTNIRRWRDGLLLLKMVLFALRRLKFV